MGNATTDDALAARGAEVVGDPALRDLPYKIELESTRYPVRLELPGPLPSK